MFTLLGESTTRDGDVFRPRKKKNRNTSMQRHKKSFSLMQSGRAWGRAHKDEWCVLGYGMLLAQSVNSFRLNTKIVWMTRSLLSVTTRALTIHHPVSAWKYTSPVCSTATRLLLPAFPFSTWDLHSVHDQVFNCYCKQIAFHLRRRLSTRFY